MAGQIPDLIASVRTGTGKGAARQSRREGNVPGIVFGGEAEPLPINIPFNKLFSLLKAGRFKSTLFNLKLEGHDDVRSAPHRGVSTAAIHTWSPRRCSGTELHVISG